MQKIAVEELKVGMTWDAPAYIDDTNEIAVKANVPISEKDIKKLMLWGVSDISTEGNFVSENAGYESQRLTPNSDVNEETIIADYNNLMKQRTLLLTIHKHAMDAVESAYDSIKNDRPFDLTELEQAADEIIKILSINSNIFLFLHGLGESKSIIVRHSVNVAFYSVIIGMALKYNAKMLKELAVGALLIDAGMVKMPPYIIAKRSKLTEHEYNTIKTHPLIGYKAIRSLGHVSATAAEVCLQHHERLDGNGYPRGLKGDAISELAKIGAIADSYDAQITKRSYRNKVSFYKAISGIIASSFNKFDLTILKAFVEKMSTRPIGSFVRLNDKSIGMVIGTIPSKPNTPVITLIFDSKGRRIEGTEFINLSNQKDLYITETLDEEEVGVNIFDVL